MLVLFVDAVNPEYLKYMPYLSKLYKENLSGKLEVPLGYTGIMTSFFTGYSPDKHKIIDLFELSKKPNSLVCRCPFWVNIKRLLFNQRLFYTPLKINRKKAKYFEIFTKKAWPQKNSLILPTLFDILEKNNKTFTFIDFPNYYKNRKGKLFFKNTIKNIIKKINKAKTDLVFAHFLDLEAAHKYRINSEEVKKIAENLDKAISKLNYDKILIFSDHSMINIKNEINLQEKLDKLNLRYGIDYIYFLGSTLARFWFKNKIAENKIKNLLKSIKQGKIINLKQYNLPNTCDLIFLTKLGTVIHPNFYMKNKKYKAMHGWKQNTIYVIKGYKGKKKARMIDLLPTILKMMKIPRTKCDGKSLI